MSNGHPWPDWIQAITYVVASIGGVLFGGFAVISRLQSRLDKIEGRMDLMAIELSAMMDKKLAEDRHDNIYPTIDRVANIPIHALEDETKKQGQNIAILMDRDRIERQMQEVVAQVRAVTREG